jgi:hypothetical protein
MHHSVGRLVEILPHGPLGSDRVAFHVYSSVSAYQWHLILLALTRNTEKQMKLWTSAVYKLFCLTFNHRRRGWSSLGLRMQKVSGTFLTLNINS